MYGSASAIAAAWMRIVELAESIARGQSAQKQLWRHSVRFGDNGGLPGATAGKGDLEVGHRRLVP